ncbi:MAG TPA: trypsin-like peptidase domain-containing protein [Planctomycetaceae bacterium]|jgi:S1-C subfamily serine protease
MKYFVGCLCAAVLGAVVAVTAWEFRAGRDAVAADGKKSGPALPAEGTSDSESAKSDGSAPHREGPHLKGTGSPLALDELSQDEQVNIAVYENVNRAVVNITTRGARAEGFFQMEVPTEGAGSGSILDKAGHIVTNNHVIDGARQVMVTLFDGKSYEARFVGADPINDVAVIKVDVPADMLHPVVFGDSRRLKVGMRVFAIGNPFGLERTLTTGIISSLNRSLQIHEHRSVKSIIQIDAAINPGNSGGPLLDSHSRLIGMNTAIATKTGQSAGVGFAIPVGLIARIVPQLVEKGHVVRPEVGIARVFETEHGLLIERLIPGGPAERAGLQGPRNITRRRGPFVVDSVDRSAADLIVAVDGKKVTNADDFLSIVEAKEPGDQVSLTIVRKGKELQVPVVLGGE